MPESVAALPGYGSRALSQLPRPTHLIRGIYVPGADHFGRQIFEVGNQRFTQLEDFKQFVRSLPRGAILAWDSGCFIHDTIPLESSDMTIAAFNVYDAISLEGSDMTITAFQAFCHECGVEFRYIYGY